MSSSTELSQLQRQPRAGQKSICCCQAPPPCTSSPCRSGQAAHLKVMLAYQLNHLELRQVQHSWLWCSQQRQPRGTQLRALACSLLFRKCHVLLAWRHQLLHCHIRTRLTAQCSQQAVQNVRNKQAMICLRWHLWQRICCTRHQEPVTGSCTMALRARLPTSWAQARQTQCQTWLAGVHLTICHRQQIRAQRCMASRRQLTRQLWPRLPRL